MKLANTGMILGKFLPPHRGHIHLVEYALARVEKLFVVVGTLSTEPINGSLRFQWMKELFPTAKVIHLDKDLPQYPHEHPDFWNLWIQSLRDILPETPELVFSSEDYGDELALRLGAKHILVDKNRTIIPTSGTRIREDPYYSWHYLPSCVRAYFTKRVVIFGSESTGKTTLAKELAAYFETEWVPEYARTFLEKKPSNWTPSQLTESDFIHIAHGQLSIEQEFLRKANKVLFYDTNLLASTIWAKRYLGECPVWLQELAGQSTYHLYLHTDISETSWEPDFLRDSQHLQESLHLEFSEVLTKQTVQVKLLSGPLSSRLKNAIVAVEQLFLS